MYHISKTTQQSYLNQPIVVSSGFKFYYLQLFRIFLPIVEKIKNLTHTFYGFRSLLSKVHCELLKTYPKIHYMLVCTGFFVTQVHVWLWSSRFKNRPSPPRQIVLFELRFVCIVWVYTPMRDRCVTVIFHKTYKLSQQLLVSLILVLKKPLSGRHCSLPPRCLH